MKEKIHFYIAYLLLIQIHWVRSHVVITSNAEVSENFIFGMYDFTDFWHWLLLFAFVLVTLSLISWLFLKKQIQNEALRSSFFVVFIIEVVVLLVLIFYRLI